VAQPAGGYALEVTINATTNPNQGLEWVILRGSSATQSIAAQMYPYSAYHFEYTPINQLKSGDHFTYVLTYASLGSTASFNTPVEVFPPLPVASSSSSTGGAKSPHASSSSSSTGTDTPRWSSSSSGTIHSQTSTGGSSPVVGVSSTADGSTDGVSTGAAFNLVTNPPQDKESPCSDVSFVNKKHIVVDRPGLVTLVGIVCIGWIVCPQ
jgi:hypothetical protein